MWIACTAEEVTQLNYQKIFEKSESVLKRWVNRNLSLHAKICVINALVGSLFVYKLMVLPNLPEKLIKDFEKMCEKFIWNGSKPKISLKVLQANEFSGGAKLINLRSKEASLKITWLQVLKKEPEYSRLVYTCIDPVIGEDIWRCNLAEADVGVVKNLFWGQVLKMWADYNYKEDEPHNQMIWWNSKIRIQGKPFRWEKPYKFGLRTINQMFCNGLVLSFIDVNNLYGLTQMEYNALVSAIPKEWKLAMKSVLGDLPSTYDAIVETKNLSKKLYSELTFKSNLLEKVRSVWILELESQLSNEDFQQSFLHIKKVTNVNKFRSFQFRLLHRAIITNKHLFRWNMLGSNTCTFCDKEKETYKHLFILCPEVEKLWLNIEPFMNEFNNEQINFGIDTVIYNRLVEDPGHIKNFICLLCKQYIYRQRCKKATLNFQEFSRYVYNICSIEKFIATKNGRLGYHERKWNSSSVDAHCIESEIIERDNYVQQYIMSN